jgi:hypothetical protein
LRRSVFEKSQSIPVRRAEAGMGPIDRLDGSHECCSVWLDARTALLRVNRAGCGKCHYQHRSSRPADRMEGTSPSRGDVEVASIECQD